MTLSITFDSTTNYFHLTNQSISYIIELLDNRYLIHRYWGKSVRNYSGANRLPSYKKTFASFQSLEQDNQSFEFLPQECPLSFMGDYKEAGLKLRLADQSEMLRPIFHSYNIFNGVPNLPDLPHARATIDEAKTLVLTLIDSTSRVQLDLFYSIFKDNNTIIRSSKLTNLSSDEFEIQHFASATIDTLYQGQQLTSFYGSHQKEFQLQHTSITHGQFRIGSSRGASGPQYPPFIAISDLAHECYGEVRALTLIYSGNHTELIERDQYDQLRLQIGLNPEMFSWKLGPKECFSTPQAVLVYSDAGFNGMSHQFHHFTRHHLLPSQFKNEIAPILINSWEMTYFDVNEEQMLQVIEQAHQLGFEAVVLDDGWFSGRNSSKTSLGDWHVDPIKFPNDLTPLVNSCQQKGMKFGIWFEPEMISAQSQLCKEKPEWIVKSPYFPAYYGRNQYVLDLTQKEVQDWLIQTLSTFIETYHVDYIKWDMNRHLVENESQLAHFLPKEFSHRYMLGLYRVLNYLTQQFPNLLFENCSSGGGRLDFGMLYYFPQTWLSDNTDGLDRQAIQYGASYLFHPYQLTGHVSAVPNHQTNRTTPLQTRMDLADSTNMGYELNILKTSLEDNHVIAHHINRYKSLRQLIQTSRFYRLLSPFDHNATAWLFESEDKENYYLVAFRNTYSVSQTGYLLRIPYLDDNAYYITSNGESYTGSDLKNAGLFISFEKGDYQSYTLYLKKKRENH
ncbi:alpha-galactosidase [Streptococcus sp. zg-86]|uniref:Alpha-galactosidase n=1 Tax=Streptococcus zhangguiae TaxID=2664091 RepID=A0A6I4RPG7_9STRE|nr:MULTISPECIES: alpha-galactosidase [unclassified Streptococcus]MTB64017.1 alpha-galactosidase [Streptococcus sp. zg-86]MTB90327.1 alpha-galactosidase [Streptococcus sp. zg-36]MWV56005.1 alpha-galactosidase [Streptococcus sp. zg-70]QTH47043.1 alpha-galactosidase [Streptococcus sp. zg-86]